MGSFPWLIYKKFDYFSTKQHNPFKTHAKDVFRVGTHANGGIGMGFERAVILRLVIVAILVSATLRNQLCMGIHECTLPLVLGFLPHKKCILELQ